MPKELTPLHDELTDPEASYQPRVPAWRRGRAATGAGKLAAQDAQLVVPLKQGLNGMAEGSIGTAAGSGRAVGKSPYFDLPASPEQLEAVGRIAAAWSYLESVLEAAIWSLCVLDEPRGRALTTHMNVKMRIESLQTLLHVLGDDESARDLSRRRKRIEKLGQKRNEIVHGLWVRGEYGSPMILSVRARGTLEQRKAGRPASAMFTLADTIAETAFDLREMLIDRAVFR